MDEAKLSTECNVMNVDDGCSTVRITHLNRCVSHTQNAKWVQFAIPIGMGVLYLFTFGLFYIGWIHDVIWQIRNRNSLK